MAPSRRTRRTGSASRADASRADLAPSSWWLTAAVDALDDHLYFGLLQPDGSYEMLFAGPNLDRLLGGELPATVEEVNATWKARIDPADLPAYRACEVELLAGRPAQVDYRVHGLDGVLRWIRARVHPEQLGDGSVRFAGILSDITQQRAAEDDLRLALADLAKANARLNAARGRAVALAMTDALTGAANRRHVDRVLTDLLQTSGPPLGVLLLDIDDFKEINDRHGHRVGDEVLIEVVARMREAVRPGDIVARWGGEEFLLVCGVAPREGVRAIGERIRTAVGAWPIVTTAGELWTSVSVGAVTSRGLAQDADPLIDAADAALLAAKRAGKDRTVVARPPARAADAA
jgi:diguanylate cyclase (GGDEF)-like protein